MSEYVKQAKDFLASCNATMEIKYVGLEKPNWDDKPHRTYDCTIKTPRGEMMVHFYDSLAHTEALMKTTPKYLYELYYPNNNHSYEDTHTSTKELWKEIAERLKRDYIPTEYDILACLTTYDVGTMDDFMHEFGYEIKCVQDMTNFINTYNAVVKEYNDVRRCFTEEQIEALAEIW